NILSSFNNLYGVIDYIYHISKSKKINVNFHIHDYFCICPRSHLLYKGKYFCNVNDNISLCNKCISKLPYKISEYRNYFQKLFDISNNVFLFSNSSKEYINKIFRIDQNKINLIPHEVNWINKEANKSFTKDKLNVGILGNITDIK
ncbi:hypothetical protein SZ51_13280, partial [Brachyspira hyodysenteriae]|uniref:hypothetical protein n=1 Tax=Brachyspira hyodysenteriae TaxID=159 RepID=UPI00063DCEDE